MKNYISELITRYFGKRYNPDIETKIQRWLIEDNHQELKEKALSQIWDDIESKADKSVYRSLKEVNSKIGIQEGSHRSFFRLPLPRVAAIIIPLFVLAGIVFYQLSYTKTIEVVTLAGEQRELKLPDGSVVWLNACSKIIYPEKFSDTLRNVTLIGEAYFSVVRNEQKRFEVSTSKLRVEVLGTQFNVRAYPDDKFVTAMLTSGKVTVELSDEKYTLCPNQELVYNTVNQNVRVQAALDNEATWRGGSLIFNELNIAEIFKELERRFNVKFDYSQISFSNDKYSIKFTGKETLSQILGVLQDVTICPFTYTANAKTIIITNK